MSTKKKKIFLTLEKRVEAIKMLDQGRTAQYVADHFGCGRTQIQVRMIKTRLFSMFIIFSNLV